MRAVYIAIIARPTKSTKPAKAAFETFKVKIKLGKMTGKVRIGIKSSLALDLDESGAKLVITSEIDEFPTRKIKKQRIKFPSTSNNAKQIGNKTN